MPIVNKGVFEVTDLVYERQLGNDWPTVTGFLTSDVTEAPSNLYYTNARVQAYLDTQGFSSGATGTDLSGNTTTDLAEGDNLYYTNTRVLAHLAESNVTVKSLTTAEAGTPSITSATNINLVANSSAGGAVVIQNSALRIKSYSTVDRANLTPSTGDLIYNTTVTALQVYNGSGWSNVGSLSSLIDFTTDDLAEASNLYYTNARVNAYVSTLGFATGIDLSGNTTTDLAEGDNLYYTNVRVQAYLDDQGFSSGAIGTDLSGNTTTDLTEGNNLYFTAQRARESFVAGYGITISETGIISSTDDSASFNLSVDSGVFANVSDTLSNVLVFPTSQNTDVRYILKSIHLTNISEEDAYVSGNINLISSNSLPIADLIPIPYGTVVELLIREQAFEQGDQIKLQGFNSSGVATANVISSTLCYETIRNKPGLLSAGVVLTQSGINYTLLNSDSFYSVTESIKLINLDDSAVRAKVSITDSGGNVLSYLAYNLAIPEKTSIEILQAPKNIPQGSKVLVSLNNNANVSAIISIAKGGTAELSTYNSQATAGSNINLLFNTNIPDGTLLYYTIE